MNLAHVRLLRKVYRSRCLTLWAEINVYDMETTKLKDFTVNRVLAKSIRLFKRLRFLPLLDYLCHLVSNKDIELIYYVAKQYFQWKNRNNMLHSRDLQTAITQVLIGVQRAPPYYEIMNSIVETAYHLVCFPYIDFQFTWLDSLSVSQSNQLRCENLKTKNWVLYMSSLNK